jgi:hypothetical protein
MKNTTPLALLLLFSFAILLSSCRETMQSSVLEQHEAQYPDLKKKYVYQSVIRLANINKDPNFEKLIKDVRKIVIYLPPSKDSTYQIKTVRTGLEKEGYELLVEGRTADNMKMSLWVKEMGARSHYVALADAADNEMILEIDGQINMEYLAALQVADQEALRGLIEQGF